MGTFAYASPEMLLGIDSGVKVGRRHAAWENSTAHIKLLRPDLHLMLKMSYNIPCRRATSSLLAWCCGRL